MLRNATEVYTGDHAFCLVDVHACCMDTRTSVRDTARHAAHLTYLSYLLYPEFHNGHGRNSSRAWRDGSEPKSHPFVEEAVVGDKDTASSIQQQYHHLFLAYTLPHISIH